MTEQQTMPLNPKAIMHRPGLVDAARWGRGRVAAALTSARSWQLSDSAYGVAGVLLISASAGLRFGLWAGLGLLGVCCLRIDARR
jgi:hypothetical protein